MTNWKFGKNEVLRDNNGKWWHVRHRRQCVDCDERRYELADATHTEYKEIHADDVEGAIGDPLYQSDGWETSHKPASVNGYRVNGVLCGPGGLNHWQGKECLHERECPNCEADGNGEIDIIHSLEAREVVKTQCECRECETVWEGA